MDGRGAGPRAARGSAASFSLWVMSRLAERILLVRDEEARSETRRNVRADGLVDPGIGPATDRAALRDPGASARSGASIGERPDELDAVIGQGLLEPSGRPAVRLPEVLVPDQPAIGVQERRSLVGHPPGRQKFSTSSVAVGSLGVAPRGGRPMNPDVPVRIVDVVGVGDGRRTARRRCIRSRRGCRPRTTRSGTRQTDRHQSWRRPT